MTNAMVTMSQQVGEDRHTSAVMGGSFNASCQGDINFYAIACLMQHTNKHYIIISKHSKDANSYIRYQGHQ